MWKVLPLLALLCSSAHGQDNILATPSSKSHSASKPSSKAQPASKYQPSPAIVLEFTRVPVAPPRLSAKALFLTLKSDLTLTLGTDPVARDALGSLFDAATGGDKNTPIYLRADRTVP